MNNTRIASEARETARRHNKIRHFHLFCGLGGGARGFNRGHARVGSSVATFECLGGIDSDPAAIADFERLTGARGTVMDLFSREQYRAFHGTEPPAGWREATPADIRRAAGARRPHIVFTSPPCKGFSGLLSEARSTSARYQALNALTLRGVWLALEAWSDDPPEFFLLENVPRIQNRGRTLLDQIVSLLQSYGYATAETVHDCGELGGLAQSRKRFLLVARHEEKVPPFLYEPQTRPLRSVGEVLGELPLPGDVEAAGPMHRVPALRWQTWVRLALIEAGKDWRSLERLRVVDGVLADYGIVPERPYFAGAFGICSWEDSVGTVAGESLPANGKFSVADPRIDGHPKSVQYGVRAWNQTAGVVTGKMFVGGGPNAVADPRVGLTGSRFNNVYRVVRWSDISPAVTAGTGPTAGGLAVSDPRMPPSRNRHVNLYRVADWDGHSHTVTGATHTAGGAMSVADPRTGLRADRPHYQTGGHYGVVPWDDSAGAVTGTARHDKGPWSVADPRPAAGDGVGLPAPTDRGVYVIHSTDGTWHRPFTTLELAALQGLVDPGEHLELTGASDSSWRERIGNAVPPPAAAAIASVMAHTLLLAWSGETFVLNAMPIWVRPLAVALSVDQPPLESHKHLGVR